MDAIVESLPYWDPYDAGLVRDPYPVFARLREEQPLYYNEKYDFYALSRYDDVAAGLADRDTYISGRGGILEFIKSNAPVPPGVFIFEDPPLHGIHRGLLTRVFTPKKMGALEPLVRDLCAKCLDPFIGQGGFDVIADLGGVVPMRVIGLLLGIPEADQQAVRARGDAALRTEAGKPQDFSGHNFVDEGFADYIDWRAQHPSDDLMTELLRAEFADETGTTRRLTRDEVLIFINVLATAGNETTNRLIGWTAKVLAEHPDQRRQIAEDRGLIPQTIEEVLRFEPPAPHIARYVARDVALHGQTVPEGSAMIFLPAAANRDERKFKNGESFDINRERLPHISFGHGFHVCLGNALARVEGRVVLDELLNRFPEWDVDLEQAQLSPTSTVRGWETLPIITDRNRPRAGATSAPAAAPEATQAEAVPSVYDPARPGHGRWRITMQTPMGAQVLTAEIATEGKALTGAMHGEMGDEPITGTADGSALKWTMSMKKPVAIKLSFDVTVDRDRMEGKVKLGMFGTASLEGERI